MKRFRWIVDTFPKSSSSSGRSRNEGSMVLRMAQYRGWSSSTTDGRKEAARNTNNKESATIDDIAFMTLGQSLSNLCTMEKSTVKGSTKQGHHHHHKSAITSPSSSPPPTHPFKPLPEELHTESDALEAMKEILSRIGAGVESMQKWRNRHFVRSTVAADMNNGAYVVETNWVEKVVPSFSSIAATSDDRMLHDRQFIQWAVEEAYCVISPFVELRRPPPLSSSGNEVDIVDSTFYAKKAIPAGVILFSVPSELSIQGSTSNEIKDDDEKNDHITAFFRVVEDLCLQIAVELPPPPTNDGSTSTNPLPSTLSGYIQYLTSATSPPRNLPYLKPNEVFISNKESKSSTVNTAVAIQRCVEQLKDIPLTEHSQRRLIVDKTLAAVDLSLSQLLWFDFHVVRSGQPMRLSAFRIALLGESIEEQRRLLAQALDQGVLRRLGSKTATAADVSFLRNLLARKKETSRAVNSATSSSTTATIAADEEEATAISAAPMQRDGRATAATASLPPGHTLVPFLTPDECDGLLPSLPEGAAEEFSWLVSIVLSRRLGSSLCVPLLDKLQHYIDPLPSDDDDPTIAANVNNNPPPPTTAPSAPAAYYSMASRQSMTGMDVFENIIAGVEGVFLFEPYIHVYALRDIAKGERITLSYSDLNPNNGLGKNDEGIADNGKDVSIQRLSSAKQRRGVDDLMWKILWGFLPARKSTLTEDEIRQIAGFITGNRIHAAQRMFPPPVGATPPTE